MPRYIPLLLAFVAFTAPQIVFADVLIDNYTTETPSIGYVYGSNNGTREGLRVAQSFLTDTTDPWDVTGITTRANFQGTSADGVVWSIQADSAGEPNGTMLCSKTIDPGDAMVNSRLTATFTTPCENLALNTLYWIVYQRETEANVSSTNNYITYGNSGVLYANGSPLVHKSGSWGVDGTNDFLFEVLGNIHVEATTTPISTTDTELALIATMLYGLVVTGMIYIFLTTIAIFFYISRV